MAYSKDLGPKGTFYILAFMALVFSTVGGVFLYLTIEFSNNAIMVTGRVINVSASYNDGSTTYKPTIAYVDNNGDKQTGQSFLSSSSYNYPRGAEVEILYDTRDPSQIRINSWFALWGFPLIFLGVGLLLAVIAIIVVLNKKKRQPEGANHEEKPATTYSYSSNADDRAPTVRR